MIALLVTSGKGGTGKTLVSSNLAIELSKNYRVGLIDADIRAPNLTYVMGIEGKVLDVDQNRKIIPYKYNENLEIFSTEHFFYKNNHTHRAIIIPGETVRSMIDQAVYSVAWSNPKFFVIDSDPSTSDVLIELSKIFKKDLKAVVVSTNSISSVNDCERTIDALRLENINIVGIVGNMIWNGNDQRLRALAEKLSIPYLGYIPYDHDIELMNDEGKAELKEAYKGIIREIIRRVIK